MPFTKDGKRRLVGPYGAVFVPNVDDDTIRVKLASGEWQELVVEIDEAKPAAAKPGRRKAR